MRDCFIAPSILAADLTSLKEEFQKLDSAKVDVIHLDVMDGHFVPNLTFGLPIIKALRPLTKIPFDAHLMISNADAYLEEYQKAGVDWISVHIETIPNIHSTIKKIKSLGLRAGIALNPSTPISKIESVMNEADYILVMSVQPGFAGQSFTPGSFDKVKEIKMKLKNPTTLIQMDGGIKKENLKEAFNSGVDIAVLGTGFFSFKDYKEAMKTLKGVVHGN